MHETPLAQVVAAVLKYDARSSAKLIVVAMICGAVVTFFAIVAPRLL